MSRTASFVGGVLVVLGALLPPLHGLAEELFSAHMVQHLLLMVVAAPLLAWGAPRVSSLGAATVWLLSTAVMWAWHLPVLYDGALDSGFVHGLEHTAFLGGSFLLWSFVLRRQDVSHLQRVGVTFATALQSGALGALLAFATTPLYESHLETTAAWAMTPLEDQQLAGAIMWVPPGGVYLVVMIVLLYRWFSGLDRSSEAALGGETR